MQAAVLLNVCVCVCQYWPTFYHVDISLIQVIGLDMLYSCSVLLITSLEFILLSCSRWVNTGVCCLTWMFLQLLTMTWHCTKTHRYGVEDSCLCVFEKSSVLPISVSHDSVASSIFDMYSTCHLACCLVTCFSKFHHTI